MKREAHTSAPFTYYSGTWTTGFERFAHQFAPEAGLLVTPLTWHSLKHKARCWPGPIAFDNGVFSETTPFCPQRFRLMLSEARGLQGKTTFVVAPDVVGDAEATIAQFDDWEQELHRDGWPVALAAQNDLENMQGLIRWDRLECLFIGGDTKWKIGEFGQCDFSSSIEKRTVATRQHAKWIELFREATERTHVHMGRVNSWRRMEMAGYGVGCASADGNYLKYGPEVNLPNVELWLRRLNWRMREHHEYARTA